MLRSDRIIKECFLDRRRGLPADPVQRRQHAIRPRRLAMKVISMVCDSQPSRSILRILAQFVVGDHRVMQFQSMDIMLRQVSSKVFSGPIKQVSDMTTSSRIESMGGLVICANSCRNSRRSSAICRTDGPGRCRCPWSPGDHAGFNHQRQQHELHGLHGIAKGLHVRCTGVRFSAVQRDPAAGRPAPAWLLSHSP